MQKIGILTYHTGYNYGASLQAYALQKILEKMGYKYETINFETMRFLASREMFSRKPTRLKEIIKMVTRIPYYSDLKKRQYLFDQFTQNNLKLSSLYRTEKEVEEHSGEYDCIICGSDQIWNLSQNDAPAANMIYYLNFPKKQKRISYAASFGKWVTKAESVKSQILPWLKEFDCISVREQSGADFLKNNGINCTVVLDPTVLLDKEDYELICAPRLIEKPYVLMFSWNCSKEVIKAAKEAGKELGLPVYSLTPPPRTIFSGITRKMDVGPCEFLSMIKYADFVVTDSFHGTAFSTTFEKPYVSIVSGEKADPRMESLLTCLGLGDHLVRADEVNITKMKKTNYDFVRTAKADMRKKSFEFLQNALRGLEKSI